MIFQKTIEKRRASAYEMQHSLTGSSKGPSVPPVPLASYEFTQREKNVPVTKQFDLAGRVSDIQAKLKTAMDNVKKCKKHCSNHLSNPSDALSSSLVAV